MQPELQKAHLQLHIAIFLWGFTAILGKLISLPSVTLVWWRLLITCISLLMFPVVWRNLFKIDRKKALALFFTGFIVGLHWLFFYASVKLSNVSVTLSFVATSAFFTSFFEPLITKRKFKPAQAGVALLVVPGALLAFQFSRFYWQGVVTAIIAAVLAATFTSINKKLVANEDSVTISFIQLLGGLVFLSVLLPGFMVWDSTVAFWPAPTDWVWIGIMALVCTTFAYVIAFEALKHLSAFNTSLAINLEPVYGILLAFWFFNENEQLNWQFFMGTFIILVAVFLKPVIDQIKKHKPYARLKNRPHR